MSGGFDYGDKARNDAEAERVREQGRQAARAGEDSFGAGGYKPGDMVRAHYWLQGYNEKHVIGVCAKCREELVSMRGVVEARDGALFHGRCWGKG